MDALDANMLIYVAGDDPSGTVAAALLSGPGATTGCIGSVLLLPELLSYPLRMQLDRERARLQLVLARLDLKPVDQDTADLAAEFGAKYTLRAIDAVHRATAVVWGANRFHTNNSRDFSRHIDEIEIVLRRA